MSLRKRYRLTGRLDRIQIEINSLPDTFVADTQGEALRILNALDAAVDTIQLAHKFINDGIIDG